MRMLRFLTLMLLIPALAIMLAAPLGCKKTKNDDGLDEDDFENGGGGSVVLAPLKAPKDGTIKGTVTFDGDPPKMKVISATQEKDPKVCHDTAKPYEFEEQKWIINDKKQVANVLVKLEAPEGKRFDLSKDEIAKWMKEGQVPKTVDMKQPHCAFVPHVVSLFTEFKDAGKKVATGQEFWVYNNAPIKHNTKITGADSFAGNQDSDQTISINSKVPLRINPQSNPLNVGCTIHPWMSAYVWSLNHPYHSVSDMNGAFAIHNAPTGVALPLVVWHEDANAVVSAEGISFTKDGNFHRAPVTFKKGDNPLNIKISTK